VHRRQSGGPHCRMAVLNFNDGAVSFRQVAETGYHRELRQAIERRGGIFNAHLHIDRSGTYPFVVAQLERDQSSSVSAISLQKKHSLVTMVHQSEMYRADSLYSRIGSLLNGMTQTGTTRADTTVDVTDDGLGLAALEVFLRLKEDFSPELDLRIGAYNPLGFREKDRSRWKLLDEAIRLSDFVISLPERDDKKRYPEHIGFEASVERVLERGFESGKEVHIHVDQENHEFEKGSETVLSVLQSLPMVAAEQQVWLIHAISPASYDDARFENLMSSLFENHVGIIVCPSAALSMRQVRKLNGPMRNSIARVLEFAAAGIQVRLGSDNLFDITSPAGTLDLLTEVFVLAHALRFFDIDVLAAFATGQPLSEEERDRVREHLERNQEEEAQFMNFLGSSWS
jgi:cytosine/creatinine deaminase